MDSVPPPDSDETQTTEIDLGTNIDLGIENSSPEKSENEQTAPSDDMFFSTISDPEPKIET